MSYITWNTKSGSLGAVAQSQYYEFPLSATDSAGNELQFTHIAGTMPIGMRVDASGIVKGVPVIQSTGASKTVTSLFTIRASDGSGTVADRSFSITVNNFSSIKIDIGTGILGTFDDGKLLEYQFKAISDNPNPTLTWSIINGETPIDIVSGVPIGISQSGLLYGYIGRLLNTHGITEGYDETAEDSFPYDFTPVVQDRSYTFTVMVTDGSSFDTASIRINVVAKGRYTADNTITIVNNTFLTVDEDKYYPPIITTDPSNIPVLTVGDNFTYKFDAIDPLPDVNGPVAWGADFGIISSGMTISSVTGWMSGTIPPQVATQQQYSFNVYAYKRDDPALASLMLPVKITTVKDSTNYISWITQANLGIMINGSTSEYTIQAVNNAGKDLTYSQVSGNLPSGFTLYSNGEIVGRNGFEYFSFDNHSANVTVDSTAGITTGMTVEGPGVASGCKVIGVYGNYTVKIEPATFVTEGSQISFVDLATNIMVTKQLTSLSSTTVIDGGKTTFDNTYTFTVQAQTTDQTVTDTKTFTIIKSNYNRAPYENLWLSALMLQEQRDTFAALMSNVTYPGLFPPELIYRIDDPNFGLATNLRMLFIPGLTVTELSNYATAIQLNHYNKTIKFGDIKTARALDETFNVKYEVVYIAVGDDKEINGVSTPLSVPAYGKNPYVYDGQSYTTMHPNSFQNMKYRVDTGVGYSNRGALPTWMTSRQEDGKELGLVRAIVLAYTLPGASKLIAYRLKDSGVTFNDLHFVADRYQLGQSDVANYDPTSNNFFTNPTDVTDKYLHYQQYGVYR